MDMAAQITKVLDSVSQIPVKDRHDILELLSHNEWGVAFEVLCSAIEQQNIHVRSEQYSDIADTGKIMKMDHNLWLNIKQISD